MRAAMGTVASQDSRQSGRLRVLLLSQFYHPEPLFKMSSLAEGLAQRGHQVTVVTGYPNYPTGKIYPGFSIHWCQWEEQASVRILRLPLYPDHSRSVMRRSLNYLSFAASASLLGPTQAPPADILWTCPPLTMGIPAWWIAGRQRIPFVYEVQDMWPETVAATGMLSNGLALGLLGRLAQFVYRRAAAITAVSPGFKRNLIAKGVPASKIHVIPNWADEDLYQPVAPDPALAEAYGLKDRFNVLYGGNLGAAQAMENVLGAAALLGDLPRVQFVLVGGGMEEAALRRQAAELRLTNVRFVEQQPAERMASFFAWADVLLAHLRPHPLFDMTIPSKIISYLACGRPILSVTAGDASDVVRQADAGLACVPGDPARLAQAVREMYALPAERRDEMATAGRRAYLEQFTRGVLVDRYEVLLGELVASHRGASRAA